LIRRNAERSARLALPGSLTLASDSLAATNRRKKEREPIAIRGISSIVTPFQSHQIADLKSVE